MTSNPAGISCGTDCREDYPAGTLVTLTATAHPGSTFNGWAGGCTGIAFSCQVTLRDLTGVTANFTALIPDLTNSLYVTSTGGGTVTSNPAGIQCGVSCDAAFDAATVVTLTPSPNAGLTFNGWRGACTGTGTCQVPMANDNGVMAAFGATYPSHILLLQQDQLTGDGDYAAPRLVVLGPALTVAAGSHMTVEAGERIKFLPGFRVEQNATFQARINPTLRPQ
ncbi:MAG: 3-coathanger stack domain-containing protein [Chromatiaceae bacterium]